MRPQKNIQETKKRNIEIINNLKQTLSKPTIVEAQRTLKIMEKLIDRIHIFINLDTDFLVKFNQVNNPLKLKLNKTLIQQLSPDVLDLIVKEAKMQLQYRTYASIQQQLKDGEVIQEQKINQYNRVKADMAYNFKSLVRSLERHPNDIEILKSLKSSTVVNHQGSNVHEALSNYKIIMQKKLATAAEQEDSHTRLIQQLNMKIASLQKTKTNCQNQLLKLKQDRAKHSEDKKQEIDKLKSQIRQVKNHKEKQLERIAKQKKQMSQGLAKEHKTTQDSLKSAINKETTNLKNKKQAHSKIENTLKQEKSSSQANLNDMVILYDRQMENFTKTKADLQKQLKRMTDQLGNLKRHFSEIQQQRKREQALAQADRKRKQRWELLERRKYEAATRIKQAFRNWKAKSKKKKKKGGKR